jgi:hypothetical protein
MFLQRRCAAATRLCRNASGLLKALGPKHHHTGADPIATAMLDRSASYGYYLDLDLLQIEIKKWTSTTLEFSDWQPFHPLLH